MAEQRKAPMSRRRLLAMIGTAAGSSAMYQAMTTLGLAAESTYKGPIRLDGDPKGASVLVLGAGVAGLVAAFELHQAGYKVQVLKYNERAGGRCWSLRGGDRFTELDGVEQTCGFDKDLYFNPGPWRIPYHHGGIVNYCKRLSVSLEPFIRVNYNAYLHARNTFGGKPQRLRHVVSDVHGNVAELLAKAVSQDKLDQPVTAEDKELLLTALRQWGALDDNYAYKAGVLSSERRGYQRDPGGGLMDEAVPSEPLPFAEILRSQVWFRLALGHIYEFHSTIFQPVDGMDMIAKAFVREIGGLICYNAKVTAIKQDDKHVTVTYVDARTGVAPITATADWCLCTIPLSVLDQIDLDVGRVAGHGARRGPDRGICIGRWRPLVRRLVHEPTTLHAARWRGDLSHGVPGLPHGSRAGCRRGRRLSGAGQ
jgi:monoamine oxidase